MVTMVLTEPTLWPDRVHQSVEVKVKRSHITRLDVFVLKKPPKVIKLPYHHLVHAASALATGTATRVS